MTKMKPRSFEELFAIPLRNGLTRPTAIRGTGVKMVNMGEIFAHPRIGDIHMDKVPLSPEEADKYLLTPGDLLFARQSLVLSGAGKCSIFQGILEPVTFEGHLIRARLNQEVADPIFYFYYFSSLLGRQAIETIVEQVAAAGIRASDLAKLQVLYLPLPTQRAIARILGSLDDKIELNRRQNATLEALARAIFQSWFVAFDPVRAKAEGRTPAAMDAVTAALFPDSFDVVDGREVPRGWKVAPLPDVIEVNPPRRLSSGQLAPYLDMQNMPTTSHRADTWIDRAFGSGMRFMNGDTLFARITPCMENGKTAFVDFLREGEVGWGSTEYLVLRPKLPLPPQFAYYLARLEKFLAFAIANMTGSSGRQRVPASSLEKYQLVVPSHLIAKRFGEITAPFMAKIKANSEQSRTLAALRDTLLPRLLSGELRVRVAEEIIEDAM